MSGHRSSSSGVRDLRSMFESKQSSADTTSSPRGRSPLGSLGGADEPINRPTSKVRASFVDVGPAPAMAATVGAVLSALYGADADVPAATSEAPSANPDKPVAGAEEEPGVMKPADPASEGAVSRGHALPPTPEDLRKRPGNANGVKAATKKEPVPKPSTATSLASKPITNSRPMAGQVKNPLASSRLGRTAPPPAAAAKKTPPVSGSTRSSLTAPTAASMARAEATSDKPKSSPPSKPKPRETTKPIGLSSHLTAPTAASRARQDAEPAGSASSLRSSLSVRNKAPRSSLAPRQRADSSSSATSAKRQSTVPIEGSFLERMMKPTASSQSRNADRSEVNSPPRSRAAASSAKASAPASKGPALASKAPASASRSKPTTNGQPASKTAAKPKSSAPASSSSKPAAPSGINAAPAELASSTQEPTKAAEPETPVHDQQLNATSSGPAPAVEPLQLVDEALAPTEEAIPALDEATTEATAIEPPAKERVEDVIPLTSDSTNGELPAGKVDQSASAGDTTPRNQDANSHAVPALEATPAGLSSEDTIR